jgi:hypothetical protein
MIDNEHIKICVVCGIRFTARRTDKITCSFACKQERKRQLAREEARAISEARKRRSAGCEVCGFTEVTEIYYKQHRAYVLCPNHLAMIKRGMCAIDDLLDAKAATA